MKFSNKFGYTCMAAILLMASPLALSPAFASGGGGSGGGGGGVDALPQYDPVEEYRKGVQYLEAEKFSKASRAFSRVLKVAKKDANTNYLMGLAQTGLEKPKKAARFYSKAMKYNPDMYAAHTAATHAYMAAGKPDNANKVLAELDARLTKCASDCAQQADLQKARDEVAGIISGGTVRKEAFYNRTVPVSAGSAYFQSVALINQARYEEAIVDLRVTAAAFGPHPDVMNYLGYSHRKLGMFERAEHYYEIALSIDPDHRGANEYLGELYVETGQMDKARIQLAKLETICSFGCIEEDELRGWILDVAP